MSMDVTLRHNRSKSGTCNRIKEEHLDAFLVVASRRVKLKDMELVKGSVEPKKEQSPKKDLQISLKQEPAQELIKEIAVLELEVVYLEQYLLSLYRKTFHSQSSVSSPTTGNDRIKSPSFTHKRRNDTDFYTWMSNASPFTAGDNRQAYIVDRNEPLLHFVQEAIPMPQFVYTPKRLFYELEVAKEVYIRATFGVRKGHKILMSKIIESFAKYSGFCPVGVMEMIQKSMPDTLRKTIQRCQQQQQGCPRKTIKWVPQNFAFRYLLSISKLECFEPLSLRKTIQRCHLQDRNLNVLCH